MFKFKAFLVCIVLLSSMAAQSAPATGKGGNDNRMLRVENGKLFIDGKPEKGSFSLEITSFNYLFVYAPAHGLFVISDRPFEGAEAAGKFDGKTLSLRVADADVKIESSSQILSDNSARTVYAKLDTNFAPDKKSIIFGYGDEPTDAYKWLSRLKETGGKPN